MRTIEEIAIENLGVIASARVQFGEGLTVITGETGAGKTMVLTSLGLLMGGKADAASVRSGAASATVEGTLGVRGRAGALARIEDAGAQVDDDTVVVLRTVAAEGRSRAFLGGRSVPQGVLADLAAELVTVHGQADQMRLRTPAHQRAALDAFAGPEHAALLEEYRGAWTRRNTLARELDDLQERAVGRAQEAQALRQGLADVERVDPQPGEDAELIALIGRLEHVEELRAAAQLAHQAVAGDDADFDSATALVDRARRALETGSGGDAGLASIAGRVAEVGYVLGDLGTELAGYLEDLQADPGGLEAANARLAELTSLTRRYGDSLDEVVAWASGAGLRLLELEDDDGLLEAMRGELRRLDERIEETAAGLTAGRTAAASRLAETVTDELHGLAMSGAGLRIAVEPADPGPWGADAVSFLFVAHQGAPAVPLGKGASGGELSRVMLAIEVSLAATAAQGNLPVFVFDEVDAGVGGKAAIEVGRRLATLARATQVVVVTHLAQVAAFADCHVVVEKTPGGDDGITVTGVHEVRDDDRVRELARMLSGRDDSEAARRHAVELLHSSVVGR